MTKKFSTVLVANRGEIAVRVIRTLRKLGIRSVAVYSDADAHARHVSVADVAVRIGPASARESYLSIAAVIGAAQASGAQAIHPGYGFLSENAEFAQACEEAGIVLIGPPASAMRVMGDKISAKHAAVAAGVPVVPGRFDEAMSDEDLSAAAVEVGFPVLIKPAAGGGGKGMRLVHEAAALASEIVSARRESLSAFGDDTLFIERWVTRPRHIEVQVLADTHGTVLHLGERECSLQRRHQKIIEEAPSVLLDPTTRERIGASAVDLAQAVGYVGAGTVEFIVSADRPDEFFFLEMNTRLQVEHPVTEEVTGVDLVAEQIRVAEGAALSFGRSDIQLERRHAIEARVYAEDPSRGFLPTGGSVLALHEPRAEGVRIDSGIAVGSEIGSNYDPMLAKVIAWGPDRPTALSRLRRALSEMVLLGVSTNLEFLQRLLADPEVVAGHLDTELVERSLPGLVNQPLPDDALAAYALARLLELQPTTRIVDPWEVPSGWRVGEPQPLVLRPQLVDGPAEVRIWGTPEAAEISVSGAPRQRASARSAEAGKLLTTVNGVTTQWSHASDGDRVWLHRDGVTCSFVEAVVQVRERSHAQGSAEIRSPMPGVVIAIHIASGDEVVAGQPLVVVEAMKMEHTITASGPGVVSALHTQVGAQVTLDQCLAVVTAP